MPLSKVLCVLNNKLVSGWIMKTDRWQSFKIQVTSLYQYMEYLKTLWYVWQADLVSWVLAQKVDKKCTNSGHV